MKTYDFLYRWTLNSMFSHDGQKTRWVTGRVRAESGPAALEVLFELMNTGNQPEGFRSMSVGDFIQLRMTEQDKGVTWVCCNQGWQQLPEIEVVTIDEGV